jgi:hypothetical protein
MHLQAPRAVKDERDMARGRRGDGSPTDVYAAIAWWVSNHGWIEVGYDDSNRSFVRALDPGGMVWEGEYRYASLDDALAALDTALAVFIREQFKVPLTGRNDDAERAGE